MLVTVEEGAIGGFGVLRPAGPGRARAARTRAAHSLHGAARSVHRSGQPELRCSAQAGLDATRIVAKVFEALGKDAAEATMTVAGFLRLLLPSRGTFFPFFRASDRPIAIACLRLLTLLPLRPLLKRAFLAFSS